MTEHIDEAAWLAMVSHPFRLQAGGQRIDQQLCYFGTLLQVWDDAADVGMVKPWPPVLHQLVMRMECGGPSSREAVGPSSR
jgi:hypothetical protein